MSANNVFQNITFNMMSKPGTVKAYGKVLIGGLVEVNFTVMEGKNGIFAALPGHRGNQPGKDGKKPWFSDVKIPNEDLYKQFQEVIKAQYFAQTGQANAGEESQVKTSSTSNNKAPAWLGAG